MRTDAIASSKTIACKFAYDLSLTAQITLVERRREVNTQTIVLIVLLTRQERGHMRYFRKACARRWRPLAA